MARFIALGLLPAAAVHLAIRFAGVERFWVAVTAYHALCVIVPALHGVSRAELRNARRWALASLVGGTALALGIWLLGRGITPHLPAQTRPLLLKIEPWVPFVVYSMALNPLLEEWFWRAFLLPRAGLATQGVLFGFMHFAAFVAVLSPVASAVLALPALGAGVAWGWMRRTSGSLWPCIITHACADAGILWLFHVIRA